MFNDSCSTNDKLTITVTRGGTVVAEYIPECEAGLFDWLRAAFGLVHLTGDIVTNAGLAHMSNALITDFGYMAIGTGTTEAAATDTALETEVMREAVDSATQETTSVTNDTARFVNEFTIDGTYAVTEMGILNAGTGGTLLNHQVFDAINLTSGDKLSIQVDVVIS